MILFVQFTWKLNKIFKTNMCFFHLYARNDQTCSCILYIDFRILGFEMLDYLKNIRHKRISYEFFCHFQSLHQLSYEYSFKGQCKNVLKENTIIGYDCLFVV